MRDAAALHPGSRGRRRSCPPSPRPLPRGVVAATTCRRGLAACDDGHPRRATTSARPAGDCLPPVRRAHPHELQPNPGPPRGNDHVQYCAGKALTRMPPSPRVSRAWGALLLQQPVATTRLRGRPERARVADAAPHAAGVTTHQGDGPCAVPRRRVCAMPRLRSWRSPLQLSSGTTSHCHPAASSPRCVRRWRGACAQQPAWTSGVDLPMLIRSVLEYIKLNTCPLHAWQAAPFSIPRRAARTSAPHDPGIL